MKKRDFLKLGTAAGFASAIDAVPARAASPTVPITVRWLGSAMLEFDLAGVRLVTDPCLGEGKEAFQMGDPNEMFDLAKGPNLKMHERFTEFPGLSHETYDAVLLSHAHEDHFDQDGQAWLANRMPLICPQHDQANMASKGFNAVAANHGETRVFYSDKAEVKITTIPANHSQNNGISDILGRGNGYWIEVTQDGRTKTIYWAGDTFDTAPVREALTGLGTPDLVIPHIGNVGVNGALGQLSMNGQQGIDFAEMTGAKVVLPVHHSTYALYQEPVSAMVTAYGTKNRSSSLEVIGEGETLVL